MSLGHLRQSGPTLAKDHALLVQVIHEQLFVLVVHPGVVGLLDRRTPILHELLHERCLRLVREQRCVEVAKRPGDLSPASEPPT